MIKTFVSTIGSRIKIIWSPNKSQIGIEGVIIDDTKNTLVIMDDKGAIYRIGKKGCLFEIKIGNKILKVSGDDLLGDYVRRLEKI